MKHPILPVLLLAAGVAQANPIFETVPCPEGVKASTCGYLHVPENRTDPQSKTIKLFTVVVKSTALNKAPEPVVMLAGGPGEKAAPYAGLAALFPDRDFVVFDQRGVGMSQPALDCTLGDPSQEATAINEGLVTSIQQGLLACGKKLQEQGIDLRGYHATESATDVNDLRLALGYDKINLYGISYGTRLGQEVMRRFSEHLRAVVLDSVIPPSIDRAADTPFSAENALQAVFQSCEADLECNQTYPNLSQTYQQVMQQLEQAPFTFQLNGQEQKLDRLTLQGMIIASLYTPAGVAQLPKLITAVPRGQLDFLQNSAATQTSTAIAGALSWGAFFSHECRGEVAFTSKEKLQSTFQQLPGWKGTFDTFGLPSTFSVDLCKAWGLTDSGGEENTPVNSTVPTLLMAGQYDPVTPIRYLSVVKAGLPNAQVAEMPHQAHASSLTSRCGLQLLQSFMADPTLPLDLGCTETLTIQFEKP